MKRHLRILSLVFVFFLSFSLKASHVAGGDVEYECIGPRQWKIRLTIFRDCTGVQLCSGTNCSQPMAARPNSTLNPVGCTATPNNINFTLSFVSVEDVGKEVIAICGANAKNTCNNLNTVTPGPLTPSLEKYVFEGILNLNLPSLNSSNCSYWDVYWELCCRNAGITNLQGSSGQSFRIGCTINIFNRSSSPCVNNSPIFRNNPQPIVCSGKEYIINLGAVDPDNDSLTYQIDASLQQGGGTVVYQPPYGPNYPFPLDSTAAPHKNYPKPNGPYVIIDSTNGDISFNALNNSASNIIGNLNVTVKQWSYASNGIPILVGITHRDLQFYVINCTANNLPNTTTTSSIQSSGKSRYNYNVYAGNQICFTVTAKDTLSNDTTFISWNQGIIKPGKLSFGPTYAIGNGLPRPREDSWEFCWQTDSTDLRSLQYYFTVTASDNNCPRIGMQTRAFSVKVIDPNSPPSISSFTPQTGTNGTVVTLHGSNFSNTNSVSFGGVEAKSFTIVDSTLIYATVDTGATGNASVVTPKGTASLSLFTYTSGTGLPTLIQQLFSVYPNPINTLLVVESSEVLSNGKFELVDVEGKVVFSMINQSALNRVVLDVKHVLPGNYILRITSRGKTTSLKVVKQ